MTFYPTGYTRSLLSTCEIHGAQQMIFLKKPKIPLLIKSKTKSPLLLGTIKAQLCYIC